MQKIFFTFVGVVLLFLMWVPENTSNAAVFYPSAPKQRSIWLGSSRIIRTQSSKQNLLPSRIPVVKDVSFQPVFKKNKKDPLSLPLPTDPSKVQLIGQENTQTSNSLQTPEKVKGIYLTGISFANQTSRQKYIDLLERTELNSLVIDIKGSDGALLFYPENEQLQKLPISRFAMDNETYTAVMKDLQEKNIYTIARIVTFQDSNSAYAFPELALHDSAGKIWKNFKNVAWLDMTNTDAWKIPLFEAREAIRLGFDEVQFDYIRFPSDGIVSAIRYKNLPAEKKKFEVLGDFFKYMSEALASTKVPLSVDLFGLTYQTYTDPEYALGIGQRIVDSAPYFDYLSPMVYPSHYGSGHFGLKSPVNSPYELVDFSMKAGASVLATVPNVRAKSRPWLQDFDMGANYDASLVRAQINAAEENNVSGWLLWNARNVYTEGALFAKEKP